MIATEWIPNGVHAAWCMEGLPCPVRRSCVYWWRPKSWISEGQHPMLQLKRIGHVGYQDARPYVPMFVPATEFMARGPTSLMKSPWISTPCEVTVVGMGTCLQLDTSPSKTWLTSTRYERCRIWSLACIWLFDIYIIALQDIIRYLSAHLKDIIQDPMSSAYILPTNNTTIQSQVDIH